MPLSPQDVAAVQQLIARYAECIDEDDLEGYVNNFAPDGEFENRRGTWLAGMRSVSGWVS